MRFKIIQRSEAEKIIKMMKSNDSEMHRLAAAIMNVKERVRLSFITTLSIVCTLVVASLALIVFLGVNGAKWYLIPLIIGWLLQLFISFSYILELAEDRKPYDKVAKWIYQ